MDQRERNDALRDMTEPGWQEREKKTNGFYDSLPEQCDLSAGGKLGDGISRADISHKDLLALIGEIDGIDLESEKHGVAVYLSIAGQRVKLIYDSGGCINHHITRTGIASIISAKKLVSD